MLWKLKSVSAVGVVNDFQLIVERNVAYEFAKMNSLVFASEGY